MADGSFGSDVPAGTNGVDAPLADAAPYLSGEELAFTGDCSESEVRQAQWLQQAQEVRFLALSLCCPSALPSPTPAPLSAPPPAPDHP